MKKNRLLISVFGVAILSVVFVSVYAVNTTTNGNSNSNNNTTNGNSNSNGTQVQTQTQIQTQVQESTATQVKTQTQTEVKSQVNMSGKTSYEDRKKEVQSKIAAKKSSKEQNTELKNMINDNIHTINSLKQTLRSKLVAMLQTLEQYKDLTTLTDEQSAERDEKIEIVSQVRTVLQTQNQQYKTSVSNFRQDTSIDKITSLTDIVTAQATRIDILNATIALF